MVYACTDIDLSPPDDQVTSGPITTYSEEISVLNRPEILYASPTTLLVRELGASWVTVLTRDPVHGWNRSSFLFPGAGFNFASTIPYELASGVVFDSKRGERDAVEAGTYITGGAQPEVIQFDFCPGASICWGLVVKVDGDNIVYLNHEGGDITLYWFENGVSRRIASNLTANLLSGWTIIGDELHFLQAFSENVANPYVQVAKINLLDTTLTLGPQLPIDQRDVAFFREQGTGVYDFEQFIYVTQREDETVIRTYHFKLDELSLLETNDLDVGSSLTAGKLVVSPPQPYTQRLFTGSNGSGSSTWLFQLERSGLQVVSMQEKGEVSGDYPLGYFNSSFTNYLGSRNGIAFYSQRGVVWELDQLNKIYRQRYWPEYEDLHLAPHSARMDDQRFYFFEMSAGVLRISEVERP